MKFPNLTRVGDGVHGVEKTVVFAAKGCRTWTRLPTRRRYARLPWSLSGQPTHDTPTCWYSSCICRCGLLVSRLLYPFGTQILEMADTGLTQEQGREHGARDWTRIRDIDGAALNRPMLSCLSSVTPNLPHCLSSRIHTRFVSLISRWLLLDDSEHQR